MKKVLIWSTIGFLGFALLALLLWPTVLASYAWYSAIDASEDNPAVSVIPEADLSISSNTPFAYTNFETIRLPHVFTNTKVEYESSDVLVVIDADSKARYLVFKAEPLLPYFLEHANVASENTQRICQRMSRVNGTNPCDSELAFLGVILTISPDAIGLFSDKQVKLYGSILLGIKNIYITPDTTRISTYASDHTSGFIQYTPNGILTNVFGNDLNAYNVAAYNMTEEEVESLVASIRPTE